MARIASIGEARRPGPPVPRRFAVLIEGLRGEQVGFSVTTTRSYEKAIALAARRFQGHISEVSVEALGVCDVGPDGEVLVPENDLVDAYEVYPRT